MKYIATTAMLAGLVAAGPCNNNCGRAVAGTARASPALVDRSSMCADFVTTTTTVTPPAVTETVALYNRNVHARVAPVVTGVKPAYASACASVEAYWEACQCFSDIKATTVTVTAPAPVETVTVATCTQGIEYAIYGADLDPARKANLENAVSQGHESVNLGTQFSGKAPEVSGISSTIGTIVQWDDDWNRPVSLYGVQGPTGSTMGFGVVNHRGYLVPAVVGDYTFHMDTSDNAFYLWVSDNAVSGWTLANTAVSRFWPPVEGETYTHTISVTEDNVGKPIAFRFVWLNYGGPGAFSASIVDPEGTIILGQDSIKNPQILASCSGPEPLVPAWSAWAEEQGSRT